MLNLFLSFRLSSKFSRLPQYSRKSRLFSSVGSKDILLSALNNEQSITVKAISCKGLVNDYIKRLGMTTQAAVPFGELLTCGILFASNMKGEETLQMSFVGGPNSLLRKLMVIVDGSLNVRGTVGNPRPFIDGGERPLTTGEMFGEGELQLVKFHPVWKQPIHSIIPICDSTVPYNLAIYMTQSEQRRAVVMSEVIVENNVCKSAAAVFVECLPECVDESLETVIKNLDLLRQKRLSSYFRDKDDEEALHSILDDCLLSMDPVSIRWNRCPEFKCNCSIDRIWRTLKILQKKDIDEILNDGKGVEVRILHFFLPSFLQNFSFFIYYLDEMRVLWNELPCFSF